MSLSHSEPTPALSKLAYGLDEVCDLTGRCRSSIYEAINDGELRAVKSGRRTLVLAGDLHTWMETFLPIKPKNAD